jgi:hypothetical protein
MTNIMLNNITYIHSSFAGGAANAKHGWKYRLLLPFLGKYQREAMMREATEEARKQGVVNFPSNLEQIFEEPKVGIGRRQNFTAYE